jgi:hypothetical protein
MTPLTFGPLSRIASTPKPVYAWTVNDVVIILYADEILNQRRFQARIIEKLNIWPDTLRPADWLGYITASFCNGTTSP